jgi:hypothetical protein
MKIKIDDLFCPPFICHDFDHGAYFGDGSRTVDMILSLCEECDELKRINKRLKDQGKPQYECSINKKAERFKEDLLNHD